MPHGQCIFYLFLYVYIPQTQRVYAVLTQYRNAVHLSTWLFSFIEHVISTSPGHTIFLTAYFYIYFYFYFCFYTYKSVSISSEETEWTLERFCSCLWILCLYTTRLCLYSVYIVYTHLRSDTLHEYHFRRRSTLSKTIAALPSKFCCLAVRILLYCL